MPGLQYAFFGVGNKLIVPPSCLFSCSTGTFFCLEDQSGSYLIPPSPASYILPPGIRVDLMRMNDMSSLDYVKADGAKTGFRAVEHFGLCLLPVAERPKGAYR